MDPMTENHQSKSQIAINFLRRRFLYMPMGILIYVLSIGPVFGFTYVMFGLTGCVPVLEFYAPVIWVAQNTSLESTLDSYIILWISFFGLFVSF